MCHRKCNKMFNSEEHQKYKMPWNKLLKYEDLFFKKT